MKKIIFSIVFILYALFFAELFLRAMNPQPLMPRYVTGGEYGIRVNIANSEYRQSTPEVDVAIRINSQGIRSDKDIEVRKKEGIYRIVLLGDSFFMGYEVDLESTFFQLLEQRFNKEGLRVEVVNLAVSGFGTAENLIALESVGLAYQPDLIVMQWHKTDTKDNVRSKLYTVSEGGLRRLNSKFLPGIEARDRLMTLPIYPWLIENSHLYSAAREKAATAIKSLLVEQGRVADEQMVYEGKGELLDTLLIQEVANVASANDAEFVLLDVPVRNSREEYTSSFSYLDRDSLTGIHLVSLESAMESVAGPNKKLYFEQGHGHWTEEGNRVVAEYLYQELLVYVRR